MNILKKMIKFCNKLESELKLKRGILALMIVISAAYLVISLTYSISHFVVPTFQHLMAEFSKPFAVSSDIIIGAITAFVGWFIVILLFLAFNLMPVVIIVYILTIFGRDKQTMNKANEIQRMSRLLKAGPLICSKCNRCYDDSWKMCLHCRCPLVANPNYKYK